MKTNWYSAGQLAAIKLPGLPTSERRMGDRAKSENWPSRQVPCKGGKHGIKTEYLPPVAIRKLMDALPRPGVTGLAEVEIAVVGTETTVTMTLAVSLEEATYISRWLAKRARA